MNKRAVALTVLVVFIFCIGLTACNNEKTGQTGTPTEQGDVATDGETVKIGFLGMLAGVEAYIGQASKLALEDYVKELNEKGGLLGRKVEIVAYDYSKDPATESVNATNRFVQRDKVISIIGPSGSSAAMAMIPIINQGKVPVIATTATNPKVTVNEKTGEVHPYMFRVCFIDPYQGKVLADFVYNETEIRKVAVLSAIADPYAESLSETFIERFTELGGKLAEMRYQSKDVELGSVI